MTAMMNCNNNFNLYSANTDVILYAVYIYFLLNNNGCCLLIGYYDCYKCVYDTSGYKTSYASL